MFNSNYQNASAQNFTLNHSIPNDLHNINIDNGNFANFDMESAINDGLDLDGDFDFNSDFPFSQNNLAPHSNSTTTSSNNTISNNSSTIHV